MFWKFLLCNAIGLVASTISSPKETTSVFQVWKSVGGRSELPCPLSPSEADDRAVLVLWFKDGNTESIYSYDARKDDFSSGQRWQDEMILGGRAFFTLATLPPALVIDPSQARDQGLFTCRVEYIRSPSTFVKVNLSIIIPPDPPSIFWDDEEVMGTIGPLVEGEKAELVCITKGGRPTPTVTWWQEGRQMESVTEAKVVLGETIILSKTVLEANRRLYRTPIVCHAHAPNPGEPMTEPRSVSAILNITLPPLTVKISGIKTVISAGSTIHPVCVSAGAHPPPSIIWSIDSKSLVGSSSSVKEEGNVTRSSVTLHTDRQHHGATIQCKALNKELPKSVLVDAVKLNIIFKPEVHLILGRMLNISNLVEGKDAFFECQVEANPIPHRIEWFYNGKSIEQKDGIVISGANLGLQNLKREHTGSYQCAAENLEGRVVSNKVDVHIKYAPICAFEVLRTQGAAINQESKVLCRIEADPVDDIVFSWSKVLPSGREMRVPPENVTINEAAYQIRPSEAPSSGIASSYMLVVPSHIGEFGRFICRARNRIGTQKMPCIVSLVSAGPPEPPFNCTATPGDRNLKVSCREGFNGGFSQKFLMEAYLKADLISNQTSEIASWLISELKEGSEIRIEVKSQNPKGQSGVVTFLAHMPIAHQQSVTEPERSTGNFAPLLGGVLGGVFVVVLLSLIVIFTMCRRRQVMKVKSDEIVSMESSVKSGGESGPDVVTSVKRRRRLSSPSLDVLEYVSCADTEGALSTEDTDDDGSYQLHISSRGNQFSSMESASNLNIQSLASKSLVLKPNTYKSESSKGPKNQKSPHSSVEDYQHKELEFPDSCDEAIKRYSASCSGFPSKINGESERGNFQKPAKEELKKESYRPYERGKDEKASLTHSTQDLESRDGSVNLFERSSTKKDKNSEPLLSKGKLEFFKSVQERAFSPTPKSKKRNSGTQIKRKETDNLEEKCLLKEKKNITTDRIRESAV